MTAERKMKSLCKNLDFSTTEEYFQYCADSYLNGNREQCRRLFKDMPRDYKHELIDYLRTVVANDEIHNFFVKLF